MVSRGVSFRSLQSLGSFLWFLLENLSVVLEHDHALPVTDLIVYLFLITYQLHSSTTVAVIPYTDSTVHIGLMVCTSSLIGSRVIPAPLIDTILLYSSCDGFHCKKNRIADDFLIQIPKEPKRCGTARVSMGMRVGDLKRKGKKRGRGCQRSTKGQDACRLIRSGEPERE